MSRTFGETAGAEPARTTAAKAVRSVRDIIIGSLRSYVPVIANVAAFSVIEAQLALKPDHVG
jgi:hypothetical protein